MKLLIEQTEIELDLLATEREFVALERNTQSDSGKPTPSLLDAVCAWLKDRFSIEATRTVAWCVWWSVYERIDHIRQRATQDAEIAYWFHVNPNDLTTEQKIGLLSNLARVQAQSTLHQANFSGSDYDYVYHLTLLATGDEAQAAKARSIALERYVDSQLAKGSKK